MRPTPPKEIDASSTPFSPTPIARSGVRHCPADGRKRQFYRHFVAARIEADRRRPDRLTNPPGRARALPGIFIAVTPMSPLLILPLQLRK
jgi:hypothetical protein